MRNVLFFLFSFFAGCILSLWHNIHAGWSTIFTTGLVAAVVLIPARMLLTYLMRWWHKQKRRRRNSGYNIRPITKKENTGKIF
jgi:hypothetical protein